MEEIFVIKLLLIIKNLNNISNKDLDLIVGIAINKLIKLIKIVADNEYKMKLGADTQIIFISSIVELLMVLK